MKMEVVLSSPGRFDDDGPFKNEEIREWSGVDQITGMLEQARIETGQWRAFTNGSAHSYGKMVDSRQRNTVDGTVVQKARRQVEIFQSQEPGRHVQVVRASQWSSSRVSDMPPPSLLPTSPKFPFLKRSTSDEDFLLFPLDTTPKSPTSSFTRASKLRRSLQVPSPHQNALPTPQKSPITSQKIDDCSNRIKEIPRESHYLINAQGMEPHSTQESSVENHYIPISSAITMKDPKKPEILVKTSPLPQRARLAGPKSPSPRSQIPSPKPHGAQVTVVNLINSPKASIVTLGASDLPGIPAIPTLSKKKVGFCKTEVHFAADSGKVNIVETDGKPPPTNKFRRRRKNQALSRNPLKTKDLGIFSEEDKSHWLTSDVSSPKIHTTTICLGDTGLGIGDKVDFRTRGDLESPKAVSEVISRGNLGNFVSRDADDNRVLSTIVKTHETTIARVEDNLVIPKEKVTSEKKSLDETIKQNVTNERKPLDGNFKRHLTGEKKSLDGSPKPQLAGDKKSLDGSTKLNGSGEKKSLEEGGEKRMEESETRKKGENLQQKSGDKGAKRSDRAGPIYANVFGRVMDAFPVYENYRVGDEKKGKNDIKRSKEGVDKVTKRKAMSPSNGIRKSPLEKRSVGSGSTVSRSQKDFNRVKSVKRPVIGDATRTKKQPMEVVYRTAVYNMKNEKLAKPTPSKTKTGPRLLNDLICGGKPKKSTNSSKRKTSTSSQGTKTSFHPPRHWK